jgi:hypothetical protein
MPLLTPTQFHDYFETDLGAVPLQAYLDDAEAAIDALFGALATQTDSVEGLTRSVFTSRQIATITSATEIISDVSTVLASDDYRQIGGRELRRLADGTNPRALWGDEVVIVTAPVSDLSQRTRVQVDLVKLAIQYQGVRSQSFGGGLQSTFPIYQQERQAILSQMEAGLLS